ncbi:MAG: hypothetical protein ACXV3D_04740 [Halobacteriota archaeon]
MLKLIAEGMSDVDALKDELEISRVMTYTHLRDLKDQALIEESPNSRRGDVGGQSTPYIALAAFLPLYLF